MRTQPHNKHVDGERYLSLFLVMLITFYLLAISFDRHAGAKARSNCIICKYANNLACGVAKAMFLLVAPAGLITVLISENDNELFKIIDLLRNYRGPPD